MRRRATVRVLVIEDEERARRRCCDADSKRRGSRPTSRTNGVDGLWLAREHPYDLIILDIMLPESTAIGCARPCGRGRTPVLMLTAKDGEFDLAEAWTPAPTTILRKPFSFVVLWARLRALPRRRTRAARRSCASAPCPRPARYRRRAGSTGTR